MHEIGDAVYWADTDGVVNTDDAAAGILEAAEEVGRKYLDPTVYRSIRSPRYRAILDKIADRPCLEGFRKHDAEKHLNEHEKKVFDNFLHKMTQLGVIEADRDGDRGSYRFVNPLFHAYIGMQRRSL